MGTAGAKGLKPVRYSKIPQSRLGYLVSSKRRIIDLLLGTQERLAVQQAQLVFGTDHVRLDEQPEGKDAALARHLDLANAETTRLYERLAQQTMARRPQDNPMLRRIFSETVPTGV